MDQKYWQKILQEIKEQISPVNFRGWFSQVTLLSLSEEKITLSVPSAFIKNQLIQRYTQLLHLSIEKVVGQKLQLEFSIDSTKFTKTKFSSEEEFQLETYLPQINQPQSQIPLNPKYTLANFVVGLTNNLAYAAAQAVVQNPGVSYNPLFIYGPSGVGKTHLMQGIGNALLSKNPYMKLIYASSEKFMNDLVDSIQNKKTSTFRLKYRQGDILLIDDIQFISGKDSTQEEFFHTFNELQSKNSQIVLTSDRPPNEMQRLESRLLSRFQGGLMVDIQLPDFDTRVAILKAKLNEKGETLPEESLKLIAESVESNTRELEGRLIQILQITKLSNQNPNPETVKKILGKAQQSSSPLDHKRVLNTINQYFNVKIADLLGPRRQKELVLPRQIAMYIMYEECKISMEKVGEILGGRDHTTVLHGVEKIKDALSRDREVQRFILELKQQLST